MIKADITVVLTATVRTELKVARADPATRLADYVAGLRFWLELPDRRIRRILFLENSGYPLDSLEAETVTHNPHGRECEFLSLTCDVLPPNLHYGYTEFQLLDRGLARSRLYAGSRAFVKATGRYRFPAISRLLDRLPNGCEFAGDSRNQVRWGRGARQQTHCALLYFSRGFYDQQVRSLYQRMRPAPPWAREQFIENIFFDHLMPLRRLPGVVLRWPVNCDPSGVGANGDRYDAPRKRLYRLVRSAGRLLTPWWWF